jgi:hypothetical protein
MRGTNPSYFSSMTGRRRGGLQIIYVREPLRRMPGAVFKPPP